MTDECTCYLGHPDDPTADEEACTACDRAFWANPVYRLPDEPDGTEADGSHAKVMIAVGALMLLWLILTGCGDPSRSTTVADAVPTSTTTAPTVAIDTLPELVAAADTPVDPAGRVSPPSTDPCAAAGLGCRPFAPAHLDDCSRMVFYLEQWGLPARFDDSGRHQRWTASDGLGWRESKCNNAAVSPTGCCGGWWQLYIGTFLEHGHAAALALCDVDELGDVVGIEPLDEQRQACVTAWLYSVDHLGPWAPT